MYESQLAENAYAHSTRSTASPRTIEYQVFARVTRALSNKAEGFERIPALTRAIHDNLQLWTTLAADVANENNALPAELRSKIFYLFEFTRQHSAKVLQNGASPDVLIEINTAIMRGLKHEPEREEA